MYKYQPPILDYINFDLDLDEEIAIYKDDRRRLDNLNFLANELDGMTANLGFRHAVKYGHGLERSSYDARLEVGRRLFDTVFSHIRPLFDNAQNDAFASERGLRVRIVSKRENIQQIPWELLHDGERFLCLALGTPIVRTMSWIAPPENNIGQINPVIYVIAHDKTSLTQRNRLLNMLRERNLELHVIGPGEEEADALEEPAGIRYVVDSPVTQSAAITVPPVNRMIYSPKLMFKVGGVSAAEIYFPIQDSDVETAFLLHLFENLLDYLPLEAALVNARQELNVNRPGSYAWAEPRLFMTSPHTLRLADPATENNAIELSNLKSTGIETESLTEEKLQEVRSWETRLNVLLRNRQELQKQESRYSRHNTPFHIAKQIEHLDSRINDAKSFIAKQKSTDE